MKNYLLIFLAVAGLYSCEHQQNDGASGSAQSVTIPDSDSLLLINSGDYNMSIQLPKAILSLDSRFEYRSSFGDVELYVNPFFHAYLSKESIDLVHLKEELQNEGIFTRTFTEESDDELLYESTLPDGTSVGYCWVKRIEIGETSLIIRLDPQVKYSKQDIRNIQKQMNSLSIL